MTEKMIIRGGTPLVGTVEVGGAKNAVLPILAATLLAEEPVILRRVPRLRDVDSMLELLGLLGAEVRRAENGDVSVRVVSNEEHTAPYEVVSRMRASFCVLGPLLGRRGRARVSLPGGCAIGVRPIDLHLKGMEALGATIRVEEGYVEASGSLQGAEIHLAGPFGPSVTGTANVLMAAVRARGRTIIEPAACEPEVQDLAHFLQALGARITGVGTQRLEVEGVESLGGSEFTVIGDRIEAGTFMVAGAMPGSDVRIRGAEPAHLGAVVEKIRETGARVERQEDGIRVVGPERPGPVKVTTLPYPGFPTDMQAQLMALLAVGRGTSVVTEKIYPDRFMHVAELNRMGARISKEGASAVIEGVEHLSGAPVMASDLRASASLVLAGVLARGTTEVHRLYHLDRGYEGLEGKLRQLGADLERMPADPPPEGAEGEEGKAG